MGKNGRKGMKNPRLFQDEKDLSAMCELLEQGRMADNGTYYVHIGDLKWWLYYPPLDEDLRDYTYLWDDPDNPGRLLGWALITPGWVGIDVYTQPELRDSLIAKEMHLWAEEKATMVARQKQLQTIHNIWISHDDAALVEHYQQQGFKLRPGMIHLIRNLDEELPAVSSPDSFVLRGCKGTMEVSLRAAAQHGAFSSTAPFEKYQRRFENFMRSKVYQPELDIVAVAGDGQIASFGMMWIDLKNKVGLFEPVGTHPNFQRKGLGRAVVLKGLHILQAWGMQKAIVSAFDDNQPAINLYESIGFQVAKQLGTFEKDV
jgi:mycothiol synthase